MPSSSAQSHSSRPHPQSSMRADEITPIISAQHGAERAYNTGTTSPSSRSLTIDETSGSRHTDSNSTSRDATAADNSPVPQQEKEPGFLQRLVEKYSAVELENKGSVARDHLALERTFLAWLRTSLAFASIGIAITQLFRLNTTIRDSDSGSPVPAAGHGGSDRLRAMGKPLGATFVGISILVLLVGWRRYFVSQGWIIKGRFPASRGSVLLVTGITGALIVTSLVVVLSVGHAQFEKREL